MNCFKPFYSDRRQMRRLVTSSEGHVLVAPYHFQPRSTLKLLTIYRIFSTLSVQPIVCCTVMKDTHCLQIVSKPSLDLEGRWGDLVVASAGRLQVSSFNFPPMLNVKLLTKYRILGTLDLSMANRMLYCSERHPLHMKCFKTLLIYSYDRGGASDSIYLPLMGVTVPISTQGQLSNCTQNAQYWVPSQ